ncbi:MAG: V-type ATP synthase subunit E [Candidatus Bathyarchaeia archaeon]
MSSPSIELEAQLIERSVAKRNETLLRAEENVKRILQAAERECERIKAESEKQVLNIVSSELRAVRDRIIGKANIEGRKTLMSARERVLSSLYDEVESRLKDIAEGRNKEVSYSEVLNRLLIESISAIGGCEFIVSVNGRDYTFLKKNLSNLRKQIGDYIGDVLIKLDDKTIDAIGGAVVRNPEGTKTYYNTLDARLQKARRKTEPDVAKILGVI